MSTTTTYLNLNKPTGSDLVNPLVDTFPNWDIVDSAFHDLDVQSIGTATELVSQGVHALTRLDQNTKTFKFIATGNYTAGETFTVDGIQCNAYTPSGTPLATNCYVTGSVVIVSLNVDDSALTFYVSGQATAQDSERLGGELPGYYAKDSDMVSAQTDITNIKNLDGNTSIAGIGNGTVTGAISTLNTNLNELKGGIRGMLDIDNAQVISSSTFTTSKNGAIFGSVHPQTGGALNIGTKSTNYTTNEMVHVWVDGIPSGTSLSATFVQFSGYNLYFAPYKTIN